MFVKRVYEVVRRVPAGKVVSYGVVASLLGTSARAVGRALNANTFREVPCHRVVMADGKVGGFNRGMREKVKLLREEGVDVDGEKVDKKYFFELKN